MRSTPVRTASPCTLKEGGRTFPLGGRRWQRHVARELTAGGRAPLHLQAPGRRSGRHPHARLSRRGAALDRLGQPLHHHLPSGRCRGGVEPGNRRRRQGRAPARRASPGHAGRGARSFLCHARPAEIPQGAAHRIGPCRRRHAPPRHGPSRGRLSPGKRGPHLDRPAGRQPVAAARRRRAAAGAAGGDHGPRLRRQHRGDRRQPRGFPADGLCRPADAQPPDRPAPVSLRQRPAGARQASGRRGARRLPGFPGARPQSHGGAVPRGADRDGRRQCPSRQDRGALSRRRHRARPDRGRAPHRARRGRPSRQHDRLRRRPGRVPAAHGYSTSLPMGGSLSSIPRGLAEAAMQFMAPLEPCPPGSRRRSRAPTATASTIRWAWRARSCTRPTSWPRPTRAW